MANLKINSFSSYQWIFRFIDLLCPLLVIFLIDYSTNQDWNDHYVIAGLLSGLLLNLIGQFFDIYKYHELKISYFDFFIIFKSWVFVWISLIIIVFLVKESADFSRKSMVLWAIITPFILCSIRFIFSSLILKFFSSSTKKSVAIIGAGKLGQDVAKIIGQNKFIESELKFFFDDDIKLHDTSINGIKVYSIDKLEKYINEFKFEEIYICLPLRVEKRIKQILNDLSQFPIIVKFIPDLFTFDLLHANIFNIQGIPVINIFDFKINQKLSRFIKRIEDLSFSITILILLSPILLSISIIVFFTTPGSVIFKQQRYGANGRAINVYKFRSMISSDNGETINQVTKNDPRVTRFGAFLRRNSLDELPQFINVIQGRMSVVGPRPHAIAHNEQYRKLIPQYMQRHLVKPGITGLAQVNGWRGETDTLIKMEKRVELDLHYIKTWSVWLDLKIIAQTITKLSNDKNAI